jgi:formiminotetrahydrofolate cyclodeaminase
MTAGFADAEETLACAAVLRQRLLDAGETELHSYEPVLTAIRLPKGDETRDDQLEHALSAATEAPLEIARAAAEVAERAAQVTERSTPAVQGDAVAGVLLAEAATRATARLVEINLRGLPEDPRLDEVARLSERAAKARERALAAG